MRIYKMTVKPDRLVERCLEVCFSSKVAAEAGIARLLEHPAVQDAALESEDGAVRVLYDAGQVDEGDLNALLQATGASVPHGIVNRIRTAWHNFQDHTHIDRPDDDHTAGCHQPPPKRRSSATRVRRPVHPR